MNWLFPSVWITPVKILAIGINTWLTESGQFKVMFIRLLRSIHKFAHLGFLRLALENRVSANPSLDEADQLLFDDLRHTRTLKELPVYTQQGVLSEGECHRIEMLSRMVEELSETLAALVHRDLTPQSESVASMPCRISDSVVSEFLFDVQGEADQFDADLFDAFPTHAEAPVSSLLVAAKATGRLAEIGAGPTASEVYRGG